MSKATEKIKASTQDHLDIDDICDDLVVLKNGWIAMVLSTTAVNFDILSEAEQDATIYAYGAFLNSLTFPLQTLIRSKKADITAYYQHLVEAERNQPNPDLKRQIQKYKEFIQSTVQQKTILDKRFYLVVHFSPLEMGVKSFKKTDTGNIKSKTALVADAKVTLAPKRDHIVKQTARLGLFTRQLSTQELIELFYDIYNPAPTGTQRVILDAASYTAPLVEPDLEVPTPEPTPPSVVMPENPVAPTTEPVGSTQQVVSTESLMSQAGPGEFPPIGNVSQPPALNLPILPIADNSVGEVPVPPDVAGTPQVNGEQSPSPVPVVPSAPVGASSTQADALKSLQEAMNRAADMASSTSTPTAGQKV
ncbi:MAG: hypothetical protein AAB512_05140 [Patescibacteria group bacterium]